MKKPLQIIALVSFMAFFSCNENRVYEDHTDPSGNLEWNKDEVVSFDIKIIDVSSKNDVILALRYAVGYAFDVCDVIVVETTPSGEKSEHEFQFKVRDENGYLGEGAGDIFDLEEVWRYNYTFPEIGTYHYEIRQVMPRDKIHMVMEVGMIVDKVVK